MTWETFDPAGNGLKLQRGYPIEPSWQVEEDERELGNRSSVVVSERERRIARVRYVAATREAAEYVVSFFRRHCGSAGRFFYAWPELVARCDVAPTLEAVSGGTQAQRTITACFCWKNSVGRTKASPTGTLLVPANNLIKVSVFVYPPNVSQAVIYASQNGLGTEQEQTTLTNSLTWTQPDAALLVGTGAPPSVNTATETPLCKALGDPPYKLTRGAGLTYEVTMDIEEVYHA